MSEVRQQSETGRGHRRRVWLLAVLGAILVAAMLRLFVAEAFRIPTESMEPTVMAGDFVLVSKLHYGARTPQRPRLPFTDWRIPGVRLPSARLPGLSSIRHGDVIVFYHPAEPGEMEERSPYVKRVAGLPGDTVEIESKRVFVNGREMEIADDVLTDWIVTWSDRTRIEDIEEINAEPLERAGLRAWRIRATAQVAEMLEDRPTIETVEPAAGRPDGALFPPGTEYTPDDFGPVIIPSRRQPIRISETNWPEVRATLEREGRHALRLAADQYEIDGAITSEVTFEQDYYFVLGDSRDDSADSRRWGFVPRDHVIGKAVIVYFSWDADEGRARLDRLFSRVR